MRKFFGYLGIDRPEYAYALTTGAFQGSRDFDGFKRDYKEGQYYIRSLQSRKLDDKTSEVRISVTVAYKDDSNSMMGGGKQGETKDYRIVVKNEGGVWKIDSY